MNGDMMNDTTNMIDGTHCPKCGADEHSIYATTTSVEGVDKGTTYYCIKCGCSWGDSIAEKSICSSDYMNDKDNLRYGWVCPKCGAVMSPDTKQCINCSNLSAPRTNTKNTDHDESIIDRLNKLLTNFDKFGDMTTPIGVLPINTEGMRKLVDAYNTMKILAVQNFIDELRREFWPGQGTWILTVEQFNKKVSDYFGGK